MTRKKDVAAHAQPRVRFSGTAVFATWIPPPPNTAVFPLDAALRAAPDLGTQLRALGAARASFHTCSSDDAAALVSFALSVLVSPHSSALSRSAFALLGAAPTPDVVGVMRALAAAAAQSPPVGVALWSAALDDAALKRALAASASTWAASPLAAAASGVACAAAALSSNATAPARALIVADEAIAALKLAVNCLGGGGAASDAGARAALVAAQTTLAAAPAARAALVQHAAALLHRGALLVKDVLTAAALVLTRVGVVDCEPSGDARAIGTTSWALGVVSGGTIVLPLISRIAVLRGLLVNLPTHDLARRESAHDLAKQESAGGLPFLAGLLWRPLAAAASTSADLLTRQYALQTFQAWLAALRRVAADAVVDESGCDGGGSAGAAVSDCSSLIPALLQFVAAAWDARGPHAARITSLAADIFSAVLECAEELSSIRGLTSCAGLESRVVSFALAFPEGSAAWASALLKIVRNESGKRGGCAALLRAYPDLIQVMIRVAAGDPRAGVREAGSAPATLLFAFLSALRGDFEVSAGLVRVKRAPGFACDDPLPACLQNAFLKLRH
jgi:hypothetical protein